MNPDHVVLLFFKPVKGDLLRDCLTVFFPPEYLNGLNADFSHKDSLFYYTILCVLVSFLWFLPSAHFSPERIDGPPRAYQTLTGQCLPDPGWCNNL